MCCNLLYPELRFRRKKPFLNCFYFDEICDKIGTEIISTTF
jgi:hypothetical protein